MEEGTIVRAAPGARSRPSRLSRPAPMAWSPCWASTPTTPVACWPGLLVRRWQRQAHRQRARGHQGVRPQDRRGQGQLGLPRRRLLQRPGDDRSRRATSTPATPGRRASCGCPMAARSKNGSTITARRGAVEPRTVWTSTRPIARCMSSTSAPASCSASPWAAMARRDRDLNQHLAGAAPARWPEAGGAQHAGGGRGRLQAAWR